MPWRQLISLSLSLSFFFFLSLFFLSFHFVLFHFQAVLRTISIREITPHCSHRENEKFCMIENQINWKWCEQIAGCSSGVIKLSTVYLSVSTPFLTSLLTIAKSSKKNKQILWTSTLWSNKSWAREKKGGRPILIFSFITYHAKPL